MKKRLKVVFCSGAVGQGQQNGGIMAVQYGIGPGELIRRLGYAESGVYSIKGLGEGPKSSIFLLQGEKKEES